MNTSIHAYACMCAHAQIHASTCSHSCAQNMHSHTHAHTYTHELCTGACISRVCAKACKLIYMYVRVLYLCIIMMDVLIVCVESAHVRICVS